MIRKFLIISYLAISLIFIFGIILSFNDYSYCGYYTDKIINWTWLAFTLVIVNRLWKKRTTKICFFSALTLLVLSVLPMGVPFLLILNYFTTIDDYQQIKLNDNYRMERTSQHPLSMPRIYIYKKEGLLEKNIYRTAYLDIIQNVVNANEDIPNIDEKNTPIQETKLISINSDSIGIEYKILNKKGIFYHKFDDDGY